MAEWVPNSKNLSEFAAAVLEKLPAPVTEGNMTFLLTWMMRENQVDWEKGDQEAWAAFNPLNSTKLVSEGGEFASHEARVTESLNEGMSFYNDLGGQTGVMNYRDFDQGTERTAANLRDGDYSELLAHLQEGTSLESLSTVEWPPGLNPFEAWSNNAYSDLNDLDPTTFEGLGPDGVASAVANYFAPAPFIPGTEPAEVGSGPDRVQETLNQLGESKGYFYKVTDGLAPGMGFLGLPAVSTRYFYVLPIFTTAEFPVGTDELPGSSGVYWEVDRLPPGRETVTMTPGEWDRMLQLQGDDWLPGHNDTGQPLTPSFDGQGMFLIQDDENDFVSVNQLLYDLILVAGLAGTDAIEDGGIQRIFARILSDPALLEAPERIEQLVAATAWGDARDSITRNWDKANTADKDRIVRDVLENTSSGLYGQYKFYTSSLDVPGPNEKIGGLTLSDWARGIADGSLSRYDAITAIQDHAAAMPGGPSSNAWKRHKLELEKQKGSFEKSRDEFVGQLNAAYNLWGLDPTMYQWDVQALAADLVSQSTTWETVMDDIRETSKAKYPNKPELLDTASYAKPWVDIYNEEMATPLDRNHALGNADIQKAISGNGEWAGVSPVEFRAKLRGKDEWKRSRRAKEITAETMEKVGNTFGFGGGVRRIF